MFSKNYIGHESEGDKNKTLSIEEHLNKIRTYLSKRIDYLKGQGEWKIQLTTAINFFSSKGTNEIHTMHSKSDN